MTQSKTKKECGSGGSVGGNTIPPTKSLKKRGSGAKRWLFTYNNYEENWVAQMAPGLEGSKWIGGYEICPDTGTRHIQGYVEFPVKVRPIGYKGMSRHIHWGDKDGKPCHGDRADNIAYCTKEGRGFEGNLKPPRPLPKIEMYGWQIKVKEIFVSEPQQRKIHWFWSRDGSRGKSNAARWLATEGALICDGKAADMKYLILKFKEKHGDYPECIVFDIPRSMEHYISYNGIEQVVNGVFASTKYECDMVVAPYMNIIVFANFPPDMNDKDMSKDRFIVTNVDVLPGIEPFIDWSGEAAKFVDDAGR